MRLANPRLILLTLITASSVASSHARAGGEDGRFIEVWARQPAEARRAIGRVDLEAQPLAEVRHADVQYGESHRFRGIALVTALSSLPGVEAFDLALLHFANGMVVPLPLRDEAALRRLDPLVARSMDVNGEMSRKGEFPPMPKKQEGVTDARPRSFQGNRLVVADRWHPALRPGTEEVFSPWASVNSLVGVELASQAAYDRQLEIGPESATIRRGGAVFRQSCQFCHSVRGVGGHFGWDMVDPEPIYSDAWIRHFQSAEAPLLGGRNARVDLSTHVRFATAGSAARWMPALRHLSAADINDFWAWLQWVAKRPLREYTP